VTANLESFPSDLTSRPVPAPEQAFAMVTDTLKTLKDSVAFFLNIAYG